MKIGILTQPLKSNYGGILQNYALQKVLASIGFDPVTINIQYKNPSFFKSNELYIKQFIKNLFNGNKEKVFTQKELRYIIENSTEFINRNINKTDPIVDTLDLKKHFKDQNYYAVVVGSDQVWRTKYSPSIYNYFLGFLTESQNIKRIAYAASFGSDDWEFSVDETRICKDLIKRFDAISVREQSGVRICKEYFDVNSLLVLDPTLLIKKEDYISLLKKQEVQGKGGIYTYLLDKTPEKNDVVELSKRVLNSHSFYSQPTTSVLKPTSKRLDDYRYPTVESWIKGFYDSNFVITDSFHGTVFSVIFNKQFISIGNKDRGNSRFQSLLNLLDLEDRLIFDFDERQIRKNLFEPIDYSSVNKKIDNLKRSSIEFLVNNLQC